MPSTVQNQIHILPLDPLLGVNTSKLLFHAGLISAFVGGLYDGFFPLPELLTHGDFGIAAPDSLNGELTLLDGRIYQFMADGRTSVRTFGKTSYAAVCHFRPDTLFSWIGPVSQTEFQKRLDSLRQNPNSMYAIRISGQLQSIRTRAFPASAQSSKTPAPPLADLLTQQRFFQGQNVRGTMVGFWIPTYLSSINVPGYHFHFVANDLQLGGHVTHAVLGNVTVELMQLHDLELQLPDSEAFKRFRFPSDLENTLHRVERGE